MALGTSTPPRAYTRETLTTAFNWLQSQPEGIRTRATTPDALVALYMQATHRPSGARADYGQTALEIEAPVSSQAFMSDLKNLAEGLKEFDDSKVTRSSGPLTENKMSTSVPSAAASMAAPRAATRSGPVSAPSPSEMGLNDRSVSMLREVQLAMNLSSEAEALNMMIAVAYKNLKSVIA